VSVPSPTRTNRGPVPLLIAVALLAGCATEQSILLPEMDGWETRQAVLSGQSDWGFSGRIGVSAGEEGFNGKLRWRQRRDVFEASVSGPLGAGAVQIDGDGRRITLTERDGAVTELDDPEYDLRMRYGWTIPVQSLRFWALGIPDPASPAATEFGDDGQLTRLTQRNWTVDIRQYREGGGQSMPRRITAVNADAKVRLVIDNWTFY